MIPRTAVAATPDQQLQEQQQQWSPVLFSSYVLPFLVFCFHLVEKKLVCLYFSNAVVSFCFFYMSCHLFSFRVGLSLRWADVGDDKHNKVSLAFLRRKKRLGMMVKLLTKLISSSSSKVLSKSLGGFLPDYLAYDCIAGIALYESYLPLPMCWSIL